jgi:hypothetical protein
MDRTERAWDLYCRIIAADPTRLVSPLVAYEAVDRFDATGQPPVTVGMDATVRMWLREGGKALAAQRITEHYSVASPLAYRALDLLATEQGNSIETVVTDVVKKASGSDQ